jgi:hypothetical protein
MINFSFPPKPGEVTLDDQKIVGLLNLPGHKYHREALMAGAGFAIGALLGQGCETAKDANQIIVELTNQATWAIESYNEMSGHERVTATRMASVLHFGMNNGRITASETSA